MKCLLKKLGVVFLVFLFLLPQPVFAQESAWEGCLDSDSQIPTIECFEVVFQLIINVAVELAVIVLFLFIVIGGFKFITSGGDPKATESAKNTLTYAILGVILLIGIWLILNFIQHFTGIEVTVFKINV
jgi:hypothetical protein